MAKDASETTPKVLVKANELPLHGNPYPSQDKVGDVENPGFLAVQIASMRMAMEPVLTPLSSVTNRISHIVSTGIAHSQSAFQNIGESDTLTVATSFGLAGIITLTRRGFFKKLVWGSLTLPVAAAISYPDATKEQTRVLWYVANTKLPGAIKEQYDKLFNEAASASSNKTSETQGDTK